MTERCEIVSWNRFHELARRLAKKIVASGYRPDIIVAIGRGGYVPGRVLSDWLGLMDLTSFKIEHYHRTRREKAARVRYPLTADLKGRRVLLVDDVADSGETFAVALRHLAECGPPAEVRSAVLHYKTVSPYKPDYCAMTVRKWRWIVYPWAVAEDVGTFLREMDPPPADADDAARRLLAERGARVPRKVLADLLALSAAASGR
jgi:hypothetical protein